MKRIKHTVHKDKHLLPPVQTTRQMRKEELHTHSSFLRYIMRLFPNVQWFANATKEIGIPVRQRDIDDAQPGNPSMCAVALGATRNIEGITGAAINRYASVLIFNETHAVRYRTPQSTHSNLFAFDRGGRVEPGVYALSAPSPSDSLVSLKKRESQCQERTGHKRRSKGQKYPKRKKSHEPISMLLRTWGNAQTPSTMDKAILINEEEQEAKNVHS